MLRPVGSLAVQERQLGEDEHPIGVEAASRSAELRDDGVRLIVEALLHAVPPQQLDGVEARLSARERAVSERAIDVGVIDPVHADRRRARGRARQRDAERRDLDEVSPEPHRLHGVHARAIAEIGPSS
jgi:hypothetical protein